MAGGTEMGSIAIPAVSGDGLPFISVAIKASVLKFFMFNIYKNNISKMFLVYI